MSRALGLLLSHSAAAGALPTLMAAVVHPARPGGYYGPNGAFELIGPPRAAKINKKAQDVSVAKTLWDVSSQLTSVTWPTA